MKTNKRISKVLFAFLLINTFHFNKVNAQAFSLDITFKVNFDFYFPGSQAVVRGLNFEPDGKLMVYGAFQDVNFTSDVLRIYDDGSLDNTWYPYVVMGQGVDYLKNVNNQYIMRSLNILFRFPYDGQQQDTSWILNTWKGNFCRVFNTPYVFSNGSMLVGGDSNCNNISTKKRWFIKYLPDGNIDTNFNHSTHNSILGILKYSNDKLLPYSGGQNPFTRYDTTSINRLCRIDTLGNLDTTFKSIFTSGSPRPIYVQNDGKIIVIGGFKIINYTNTFSMIRINPNGSLDSTFNNFSSVDSNNHAVYTVCKTTDGGYLIGGQFRKYQSYIRNNICKTDVNGFIDTTYFKGAGIDSIFSINPGIPYVFNIQKGNNDTYYVMGWFTYYNGVHVNPIIRIKGLTTGINEIKQDREIIKIFPNPSRNNTTIVYPQLNQEGVIHIYNTLGQLVYEEKLAKASSQKEINIHNFKAGLYKVIIREKGIIKGQVSLVKN